MTLKDFTFSIPIFLTVVGALILAIAPLFDRNSSKWIRVFIFLGGLIIIIAGVFTSYNQAQFQKSLTAKATNIQNQTQNVSNVLTGGDSFAYVILKIAKDPSADYLEFDVVNSGDYPIHDLSIEIRDQDYLRTLYHKAISKKVPLTLQYLDKSKATRMIGTLGPHKAATKVASATMPSALNDRNFSIRFRSLYDHYDQKLHIGRNKDGKLLTDSQIKKGDKTLYSLGNTSYFQPKTNPVKKQCLNKRWTLEHGESITALAIDGQWIAFDTKGKLVEPKKIDK